MQEKEWYSVQSENSITSALYSASLSKPCKVVTVSLVIIFEPRMTKPTKWSMRSANTLISQGIYPVWSESSLCAQWVPKDQMFLHADSEDSDQTGWIPRLLRVFAGRTGHFVGFVMRLKEIQSTPDSAYCLSLYFQVLLIAFAILRRVAWDYGRIALVSRREEK